MLDLTEEDPGESDEKLESNGVPILVDAKSLLYLDGTISTSETKSWAGGSSSRTLTPPVPAVAVQVSPPDPRGDSVWTGSDALRR